MKDLPADQLIVLEEKRQKEALNLIASENYVSRAVLRALGSVFTNKYSEGYPGARYYAGNEVVDKVERLARDWALKLFGLNPQKWHVNVQPYSGSPANIAVYAALVPLRQKIMGLQLDMGGHLTHGHKASFTGKAWRQVPYAVEKKTGCLDYQDVARIARREKPRLIITGYSAYSRTINFKKFYGIARSVGAYILVDMSHIAGLVAGGAYPSPFPYADVVMTTTHKTLRGPRGAVIFCKKELAPKIDRAVFPGLQGGPHNHQTLAIAVALREAAWPAFRAYARQIIKNAKELANELAKFGWPIVSGGTDSHLFLVDVAGNGIGGAYAESILESVSIITNKNAIPYDKRPPRDPSGIRIGTPAVTTRGMKEKEMRLIAGLINDALAGGKRAKIKGEVQKLTGKFPLP